MINNKRMNLFIFLKKEKKRLTWNLTLISIARPKPNGKRTFIVEEENKHIGPKDKTVV